MQRPTHERLQMRGTLSTEVDVKDRFRQYVTGQAFTLCLSKTQIEYMDALDKGIYLLNSTPKTAYALIERGLVTPTSASFNPRSYILTNIGKAVLNLLRLSVLG